MLGLQGEGWGTRDPFQFGDQELGSHTCRAFESRGQARGPRIWSTDSRGVQLAPSSPLVGRCGVWREGTRYET